MPVTEPPLIAELVRETQQRLGLTQEQFAAKPFRLKSKCESIGERTN